MPRIWWYGPKTKKGSVEDVVSYLPAVVESMRKHARRIAVDAAANLEMYPEERTKKSQIGMQQGNLDFYVYIHDPENYAAAQGIENGHWLYTYPRTRVVQADGTIKYERRPGPPKRRWVEGLHVIQNAAEAAIRRSKVH